MPHRELHPEQSYVFEIAEKLGIGMKILPTHRIPTTSCQEKLNLLRENPSFKDWILDRIVKALYFQKNGSTLIGIITPELDRNPNQKQIFPRVLGMSKSKAERYWPRTDRVPTGMIYGTCRPFPLE